MFDFAVIFLKASLFLTVSVVFSVINKILWLNNFKTRIALNAKSLMFVICIETIICLLYNLHGRTLSKIFFKSKKS